MTNFELIKNMSIEKLAVTITCPNELVIADIECRMQDRNCNRCCLEWLMEYVKDSKERGKKNAKTHSQIAHEAAQYQRSRLGL